MKRILLFLGTIALVSVITMHLQAEYKKEHQLPPKTYSVTLTYEQWGNVINGLESIKSAIKLSTMPANQSTYICDSLILGYQIEFNRQIISQKQSEENAAQQKKDSTITKTKKN